MSNSCPFQSSQFAPSSHTQNWRGWGHGPWAQLRPAQPSPAQLRLPAQPSSAQPSPAQIRALCCNKQAPWHSCRWMKNEECSSGQARLLGFKQPTSLSKISQRLLEWNLLKYLTYCVILPWFPLSDMRALKSCCLLETWQQFFGKQNADFDSGFC